MPVTPLLLLPASRSGTRLWYLIAMMLQQRYVAFQNKRQSVALLRKHWGLPHLLWSPSASEPGVGRNGFTHVFFLKFLLLFFLFFFPPLKL